MPRELSNTAKASMYAQQTDEVYIVLLTINNASFSTPIYVCSDPYEDLPVAGIKGVVSRGNEYVYMPFVVELPTQDDTNVSRARLSIDNISREILQYARAAKTPISVGIEIVLASDVDTPEISIDNFVLENISYNALTISGDLSIQYFDLEPFPSRRFTPSNFPGMF